MAYSEADPSELIHRARLQAGLTQGELAQRADVSRQMIGLYERGERNPSIRTLEQLLAGSGVRLRLSLVPEPGLEDEPTRALLDLRPLERLSLPHQEALLRLADSVHKCSGRPNLSRILLAGKAGARMQGARIHVPELEFVVDPLRAPAEITALLTDAGAEYVDPSGASRPVRLSADRLRAGSWLALDGVGLLVRSFEHFDGVLSRAATVQLLSTVTIGVAAPGDCASNWSPRDLDHLAVQRAWRLLEEADGGEASNLVRPEIER